MKNYFLVSLSKNQKKYLTLGIAGGILYSSMLVAIPFLISEVLNYAEQLRTDHTGQGTWYLTGGIVAFSVVTMCIFCAHQYFVNRFILSLRLSIEQRYIDRMMDTGGITSRIINVVNEDIKNICNQHYLKIFKVMNSMAFILMGMVYTLRISVKAFFFEIVFAGASFVFQLWTKKQLNRTYQTYRTARLEEMQKIISYISARLTFLCFRGETFAQQKAGELIREKAQEEKRFSLTRGNVNLILSCLPNIGTLLCCWLFCNEVVHSSATGEQSLAVIYVVGYILWEVIKLVNAKMGYASLSETEEELKTLLSKSAGSVSLIKDKEGQFCLKDVQVTGEDRIILEKVSFSFDMNKKYLITGKSGSGKSTLIRVITGQAQFEGTINGQSYMEYSLNQDINYLPQEAEILPDSIYANVAVSKDADRSCVEKYLAKLNLKTDTSASDMYSGGEIKKIEFARGLYHPDRHFWIMDEPFEGVDAESRAYMEEVLRNYKGGILLASHSYTEDIISTFDEILIFESGKLVFSGPFDDLPDLLRMYYFSGREAL